MSAANNPTGGGTGPEPVAPEVTRRGFLRGTLGAVGGVAALAAALSPLKDIDKEDYTLEKFLQKHYKEMTPEEMKKVLARIRKEVEREYKLSPHLRDVKPIDGVQFGYALNLGRCIGCRKCVYACVAENNQSRSPQIQYIRVLEMPRGSVDIERGNHHYDRPTVPDEDHYYMPIQCHQCANPPCVKVCPVEATWQEPDGVTVIDYDWCIGCRYCEAACPYWARRFNFTKPGFPRDEAKSENPCGLNPDMAYLSNRPRMRGVMEKCHFCLQRSREGRRPACLEVCPVGARKFGNLLDPDSEVARILAEKHVFVLKQEVGTLPRFFYYFDQEYPRDIPLSAFKTSATGPALPGTPMTGGEA